MTLGTWHPPRVPAPLHKGAHDPMTTGAAVGLRGQP